MRTKNIIKGVLLAFVVFTMNACEKEYETDGISKITYFPEFTVNGEETVFVPLGGTYTDAGAVATENGVEIPFETTVFGDYFNGDVASINTNLSDRYLLTYTATNIDGYAASAGREVFVVETGDLITNIAGLYTSWSSRNGNTSAQYKNMKYIMITKTGANTYKASDYIGGYYDIGRAYGSGYRAPGFTITATDIPGNVFSVSGTCAVGGFGGAVTFNSMSVDPATKTIKMNTSWNPGTAYTFDITLTQVQL